MEINKLLREELHKRDLITEALLKSDKNSMREVADFVNFAKAELGIDDDIKILLTYIRTPDIKTTAYYSFTENPFIKVYISNRSLVDVEKSICHELVHHKQNLEGRLTNALTDGADGSEIENEANAKAGEIIRKWGKIRPNIYIDYF